MKLLKITFTSVALIIALTALQAVGSAQTRGGNKTYQTMGEAERTAFVSASARAIALRIAGNDYAFTPQFEKEIQNAVEQYATRINNNAGDSLWKGDLRLVFERGRENAPLLIRVFRSRNVSPLYGLYIPAIESEFVNIAKPNSMNALGMFQFLPQTGQRFGLTPDELLDVEKSADAAARYIANGLKQFSSDPMKEALALLAYNRGAKRIIADLQSVVDEQNKACSICALTAARERLDRDFQTENVSYVPRFFAAAIIGENPRAFGLEFEPLSSYEVRSGERAKR